MKKKFNFKALLMIVLVVILAVCLVACNGNKDKNKDDNKKPPKPTVIGNSTADVFFNALWKHASGIGGEAITDSDDLAVNAAMSLEIGAKTGASDLGSPNTVMRSVKLGLDISAVVDRHEPYDRTAAKIGLDLGGKNFATLYYFLSDPDVIYIDFDGQNIALNVTLGGINEKIGNYIATFLKIGHEGDYINTWVKPFTDNMGKDWTLDTLINNVVPYVLEGFADSIPGAKDDAGKLRPLADILGDLVNGNDMISGVLTQLGISVNSLFTGGQVNLLPLLANQSVASLLFTHGFNKNTASGVTTYTTGLGGTTSSGGLNLFAMLLGDYPALSSASVDIAFDEDANGNLVGDGVRIIASLEDNSFNATLSDAAKAEHGVNPFVSIGIKHLNIRPVKADAGETGYPISIVKENYKPDLALQLTQSVEFKGLKLDATGWSETDSNIYNASGLLELGIKGHLDLSGKAQDGNALEANAWISFQQYGDNGKLIADDKDGKLIEASIKNTTITIKMGDAYINYKDGGEDAKFGIAEKAIVPVVKMIGGFLTNNEAMLTFADVFFTEGRNALTVKDSPATLNTNFKGVVLENVQIQKGWNDFAEGIFDQAEDWLKKTVAALEKADQEAAAKKAAAAAEKTPEEKAKIAATNTLLGQVAAIYKLVLPLLSTDNGKLGIKVDNVFTLVPSIGNLFIGAKDEKWSEDGCYDEIENFLGVVAHNGIDYIEAAVSAIKIMGKNSDNTELGGTKTHTGKGEDKFTVEEVTKMIFKDVYDHDYNATCQAAQDPHGKCTARYGVAENVAKFFFASDDQPAFDDFIYNFMDKASAYIKVIGEDSTKLADEGSVEYKINEAYNNMGLLSTIMNSIGGEKGFSFNTIIAILKNALDVFPNTFSEYYFEKEVGHAYNADTCGKGVKDHEDCKDKLAMYKTECYLYAAFVNIYGINSGATSELVTQLNKLIANSGLTLDQEIIYNFLEKAVSAMIVSGLTESKTDAVAYFVAALFKGMDAALELDFSEGFRFYLHVGFGGDLELNLTTKLDIVDGEFVDYSTDYKEEEGWFVYDFTSKTASKTTAGE